MELKGEIDEKLRLRNEVAKGKIEGLKYWIGQPASRDAYYIEFELADKTSLRVRYPLDLEALAKEAYGRFVPNSPGAKPSTTETTK